MSGRQGLGAIKSNVASINVNCEPGKPYIVQAKEGEEVVVEAGQEVELHCQSQGGKPPAEIQWWDDTGTRIVADMRGENGQFCVEIMIYLHYILVLATIGFISNL